MYFINDATVDFPASLGAVRIFSPFQGVIDIFLSLPKDWMSIFSI